MTDLALVIGLDFYGNPDWTLRAGVRDALRVAEWVTAPGAGRATKETLTLLLSPHPDHLVHGVAYELATEAAMRRALYNLNHKKIGAGAERLWFFYAGHGIAPAGGGPDQAPVMVPSDVTDLDFYRANPIDLGSWIREMQVCPPEVQIFFVDACRGIVVSEDVVTATKTLFFDLSKVKAGDHARQAVLFATTAGQLANEQGLHGLFGGALIDGLKGAGPELVPDAFSEEFVLTFGGLAAYTKRRIQIQSEEVRRGSRTLPTQEPAESLFRAQSSLELARFKEKPCSPVRVFINPEAAIEVGTAGIRGYNDWKRRWERQLEKRSPLPVPVVWELASTVYKIEIEASGFENWAKKVEVIGPMELEADLVPRQPPGAGGVGLESADGLRRGDVLPLRPPPRQPDGAELAAGMRGRLLVEAHDRYARIEAFDADGKRVAAGWERLDEALPVGAYRVEIALPTESPVVQSALVTADEPEEIVVRPDPQLTRRLPPSMGMMAPHGGMSAPSEMFGFSTTTHLGSVLAWAAWAAQFDPYGDGRRLRDIGVDPVPPSPGRCFVRVLVGDARAPGPGQYDGPIESLVLRVNQDAAAVKPVPALEGFAVQAQFSWHPSLTVEIKGLEPRRLPVPFVADHVWTIIIVHELTQRIEIHRYLQRLEAQRPFDDTIRLVEQNWRALDARTPLYDGEAERLLERDLDPLALAVLGYRLVIENRWADVELVLGRLAEFELIDARVLAGLTRSGPERDEIMTGAMNGPSVPVVGEGYRAMEAWVHQHFARNNLPPPIAPEPLVSGVWTAFDTRGQAVISQAFPVSDPPAWATPLLAAAKAVARIEMAPDHPTPFIGTGFLVGPRELALADFVAKARPSFAAFDHQRVAIEEVVGETDDDRHGALVRIAPVEAALLPVRLRWALPEIGTHIAVIGYPALTFTPTPVTMAAFTVMPTGEKKMIMPGVIIAVEDTMLTYECWTMAGVAGGPIVDLLTGEVLGIHHSGKYKGGAAKLGFGVPVTAIRALLKSRV